MRGAMMHVWEWVMGMVVTFVTLGTGVWRGGSSSRGNGMVVTLVTTVWRISRQGGKCMVRALTIVMVGTIIF